MRESMKFSEAMEMLQQAASDFVTEVTPLNANEAQKEFFVGGCSTTPNFVYDDSTDYVAGKKRIRALLTEFHREDFSEVELEILDEIGRQTRLKHDLLQMMRLFRHAKTDHQRDNARRQILRCTVALHGEPDKQTYHGLWTERLAEIEKRFADPKWSDALCLEDADAFCHLKDAFQSSTRVDEEPFAPRQETLTKFRDFCWKRWQKTFERVDMEHVYTPEEACDLLNTVFREDFPYPTEWRAMVSETKTSLSTNQKALKLEVPRHRGKGPYTGKVMLEVVLAHELMVHVNRREYAKHYCPEVAIPLPDYLVFEEGLAKAAEQALGGEIDQTSIDHYLTAGMAYYDNMDFAEIFNVQRWQLFLREIKPEDTAETRERKRQKADDEAFRLTLRCLRGTGAVPLMNNLVYYNGQIQAWKYIEENIDDLDKLEKVLFRSGKTDPTNPLHQKILEGIGLM